MSRAIIFFTIIGSIMLCIDIYFWQAFKIKFFNKAGNEQLVKYIYFGLSLIWMILFFYSMMQYQVKNPIKVLTPIRGIAFAIFVGKLVGIAPLLVDDILRLFRWVAKLTGNPIINGDQTNGINRLEFLQKTALGLGGLFFGLMTYGVAVGRFNFKKHRVKMKLKNWPEQLDGLKAIQISDIHLGSFTSADPIKDIVKLINDEKPDLIFFTGDLVNSFAWEAEPFIDELSKLEARYGKYSVLGNHDYADYAGLRKDVPEDLQKWQDNYENMLRIHKQIGFDLLLNENRVMKINEGEFNIVGVENWGAGGFTKYGDIDKSLEGLNHDLPTILLSHDPSHWNEQVKPHKHFIDLQLAGHTHGMQFGIELGSFKWSPVQWRYSQWAGLYENEKHQIYVNRGLGHVGYPGRVGIMPEISVIEFKS